jgi:predicted helicase
MTIKDILSEAKSPGMLAKFDIEAIHNKLQSHLMNTLMNPENIDQYLIKDDNIRNEITEGLSVRDFKQIYIVFGNPPYNVSTQNESIWINSLIKDYKTGLNEKNLKILSDDYVKVIRFAQWKIEQSKLGMVVYITNNNYLDGSVFKVMRRSLMETFNEIYIVNLHGNMRKNETGNPFNIKVGVSIIFLLRTDEQYGKDRLIIPKDKDKHTLKTLTTSTLDDYVGINDSTVEINKNIIENFQTIDLGCKLSIGISSATVDLKILGIIKPFQKAIFLF